METISIERSGVAWAIKHQNSYLGYADTLEEASAVGVQLMSWLRDEGRAVELMLPPEAGDWRLSRCARGRSASPSA